MKFTLETTLLKVLLLGIVTGKGSSQCWFELNGSGYFVYPGGRSIGNSAIPPNFYGGQRESETCRIVYNLQKNWDVSLVMRSESGWAVLHKYPRLFQAFRNDPIIYRGTNSVRVLGNETRYFEIEFPEYVIFTLRYTAIRTKHLKCPPLSDASALCSEGTNQGSKCTFVRRDVISNRRTTTFARCSKNSNGELVWKIEEGTEGTEIVKTEEKGDYYTFPTIDCNMQHCNKFPDNIRAVSCTNFNNFGSNCTLQCRDGFVPAPHLYEQKGNIFPQLRARVPQFWAECTYDERYDMAIWKPQVSTNGPKIFRNPKQLYLDCMKLEDVTDLYFRLSSHYLDFFTARRYKSCPYGNEDVANFLNEQPEDYHQRTLEEASDIRTLQGSDDGVQLCSSDSKVMLVPEKILVALNVEEWKWVLHPTKPSPTGMTCEWDSSLHMALFQHPPVKGTGVLDLQKARRVFNLLSSCVNKICLPTVEPENWTGDCGVYCIWERRKNRFRLCGEFSGGKNIQNCLVCKMKNECKRFAFFW